MLRVMGTAFRQRLLTPERDYFRANRVGPAGLVVLACRGSRRQSSYAGQQCSQPRHFGGCPLPLHPLRKGGLNQAAYSLFLFLRDCL
jgi:hypothetical protein